MNFKSKAANRTQFDLIQVDKLNYNSEWITGIEGASNKFVNGEDGLTWSIAAKEVARLNEPIGRMTRSQTRRMESENSTMCQAIINEIEALDPTQYDDALDTFVCFLI